MWTDFQRIGFCFLFGITLRSNARTNSKLQQKVEANKLIRKSSMNSLRIHCKQMVHDNI